MRVIKPGDGLYRVRALYTRSSEILRARFLGVSGWGEKNPLPGGFAELSIYAARLNVLNEPVKVRREFVRVP